MTDSQTVDRRMLLRGAGVAGAAMMGVAATPAVASAHDTRGSHDSNVVGSWLITHTDDPPSNETGHAVASFAPGGVLTEVEINPVQAPGAGAWTSHEDRFKGTFWTGDPGDPSAKQGPVVVKVEVRGKVHGDHLSGTYRVTVYDAKSYKQLATVTGKVHGDRITP
ncbi:MAG: hypothetical protein ACXVWU_07970 [Nocardioides sp.]